MSSEQTCVFKGWIDPIVVTRNPKETACIHIFSPKPVKDMLRATLILGNGFSEETVRKMLEEMTLDARVEYFYSLAGRYCFGCGNKQPKTGSCHCQNDE